MTDDKLNKALELKGLADEANRQATNVRKLLDLVNTSDEKKTLSFQFLTTWPSAAAVLESVISTLEMEQHRYDTAFLNL